MVVEDHGALPWWFWRTPWAPTSPTPAFLGSSSSPGRGLWQPPSPNDFTGPPTANVAHVYYWPSVLKGASFWPMAVLSLVFGWSSQCFLDVDVCMQKWPWHPTSSHMVNTTMNEYQWIPLSGYCFWCHQMDPNSLFMLYVYLVLDQLGLWWYVSGMCK